MSEANDLSLSELNGKIGTAVKAYVSGKYRVVAEISQLQENYTGHAYLELIEKDEISDDLLAKARATIWASTYRMVKPYFKSVTGSDLQAGMKVLLVVTVEFHELYGFSLNIKDIDPTYTLGDLERKRLEIIQKLEDEGVIDINKSLLLAEVPQRIAVISSQTAAGYGDFMNQLEHNSGGFHFHTHLFRASMQGKGTPESIVAALDEIGQNESDFDAVVIIRGGGSKTDLEAFNDYWLALNIAQFPLPVITGIGHERDESVTDLVAHTALKTPTAVAEFFIDKLQSFSDLVDELKFDIFDSVQNFLVEKNEAILLFSYKFPPLVRTKITQAQFHINALTANLAGSVNVLLEKQKNKLAALPQNLDFVTNRILSHQLHLLDKSRAKLEISSTKFLLNSSHSLDLASQKVELLSPDRILDRGYAYVCQNGKIIADSKNLVEGQTIETVMRDGKFTSEIKKIIIKK